MSSHNWSLYTYLPPCMNRSLLTKPLVLSTTEAQAQKAIAFISIKYLQFQYNTCQFLKLITSIFTQFRQIRKLAIESIESSFDHDILVTKNGKMQKLLNITFEIFKQRRYVKTRHLKKYIRRKLIDTLIIGVQPLALIRQ